MTDRMKTAKRTYAFRVAGLMGIYVVVLFASISVVRAHPTAGWRYAVALLPMLPVIPIPWFAIVFLREMDELERRIQLEALAFAFVATALTTLAYGFLQTVGLPDVNWVFVWPVLGTFWGLGRLIARRKYA